MTEQNEQNLIKLYGKLLTVKREIGPLVKRSDNPFYKSKYADLNAHLELVEPLLQAQGLVLTQSTVVGGAVGNVVKTDITDSESGAQVSASLAIGKFTSVITKNKQDGSSEVISIEDTQKLGAAITYARRFTLGSLLAISAEDDDGNTATGRTVTSTVSTKASKNKDF